MQKHVNCGAFGSVDKITCHILIRFLISKIDNKKIIAVEAAEAAAAAMGDESAEQMPQISLQEMLEDFHIKEDDPMEG